MNEIGTKHVKEAKKEKRFHEIDSGMESMYKNGSNSSVEAQMTLSKSEVNLES